MSSNKTIPFINPKRPVCKADGCSSDAAVKGHCRLHFLKMLQAKRDATPKKELDEEDLEREALLRMKRDRRAGNRLTGLEATEETTDLVDVHNRFNAIDTIDLDIDVIESDLVAPRPRTGTDDAD